MYLILVADIAALVKVVGHLPKSYKKLKISTVSMHRPENMLVFRSLFGLLPRKSPERALFHSVDQACVWQSVKVFQDSKFSGGGGFVDWLSSGRAFVTLIVVHMQN